MEKTKEDILAKHTIQFMGIPYLDVDHAKLAMQDFADQSTQSLQAEVQRLKDYLTLSNGSRDFNKAKADELQAEVERLREVSKKMADELSDFLDWIKTGDYHQSFVDGAEKALREYKDLTPTKP